MNISPVNFVYYKKPYNFNYKIASNPLISFEANSQNKYPVKIASLNRDGSWILSNTYPSLLQATKENENMPIIEYSRKQLEDCEFKYFPIFKKVIFKVDSNNDKPDEWCIQKANELYREELKKNSLKGKTKGIWDIPIKVVIFDDEEAYLLIDYGSIHDATKQNKDMPTYYGITSELKDSDCAVFLHKKAVIFKADENDIKPDEWYIQRAKELYQESAKKYKKIHTELGKRKRTPAYPIKVAVLDNKEGWLLSEYDSVADAVEKNENLPKYCVITSNLKDNDYKYFSKMNVVVFKIDKNDKKPDEWYIETAKKLYSEKPEVRSKPKKKNFQTILVKLGDNNEGTISDVYSSLEDLVEQNKDMPSQEYISNKIASKGYLLIPQWKIGIFMVNDDCRKPNEWYIQQVKEAYKKYKANQNDFNESAYVRHITEIGKKHEQEDYTVPAFYAISNNGIRKRYTNLLTASRQTRIPISMIKKILACKSSSYENWTFISTADIEKKDENGNPILDEEGFKKLLESKYILIESSAAKYDKPEFKNWLQYIKSGAMPTDHVDSKPVLTPSIYIKKPQSANNTDDKNSENNDVIAYGFSVDEDLDSFITLKRSKLSDTAIKNLQEVFERKKVFAKKGIIYVDAKYICDSDGNLDEDKFEEIIQKARAKIAEKKS